MKILEFIQKNHKLPLHIKESDMEELEKDLADACNLKGFLIEKPMGTTGRKVKIKKGFNSEFKFDSFSEFVFFYFKKYHEGHVVVKNTTEKFPYTDSNSKKRYFIPDFIVDGLWCEVKGFVSENDKIKRDAYPNIEWYYQAQIDEMTRELDTVYGPRWRDSFVQTN